MFEDEATQPVMSEFPRNLELLWVEDMVRYLHALNHEITRVNGEIDRRNEAKKGADSFFKS